MIVRTQNAQTFDFGLNGREIQDTFNLTKYKELAYRSPRGTRLSALVEERWSDWLQIVDEAPWLSSWRRSPHIVRNSYEGHPAPPMTPFGAPVEFGHQAYIALYTYVAAVWGYGILGWLSNPGKSMGEIGVNTQSSHALKAIYELQGVKHCNSTRTYLLDDSIYRGTGFIVPCEFGDLDRWLEPMWFEVCQEFQANARGLRGCDSGRLKG